MICFNRGVGFTFRETPPALVVVVLKDRQVLARSGQVEPLSVRGGSTKTSAKTDAVPVATLAALVTFWACFGEHDFGVLIGLGQITGQDR